MRAFNGLKKLNTHPENINSEDYKIWDNTNSLIDDDIKNFNLFTKDTELFNDDIFILETSKNKFYFSKLLFKETIKEPLSITTFDGLMIGFNTNYYFNKKYLLSSGIHQIYCYDNNLEKIKSHSLFFNKQYKIYTYKGEPVENNYICPELIQNLEDLKKFLNLMK